MCNLKHDGGRRFLALVLGLVAFAAASTPAAPELSPLPNQVSEPTNQDPLFMMRSVTVNNRALSGISNDTLNLPPHPDNVIFTYEPNPQAANIPIRFRG